MLAGNKLRVTPPNVLAHLGVMEFKIILHLIGAHDAGNRDAILLQDEVVTREISAFGGDSNSNRLLGRDIPFPQTHSSHHAGWTPVAPLGVLLKVSRCTFVPSASIT